ncbi:hypothetical protein MAR_028486 [Mya arenaria]|uniref:C2H2-type domain-containing protein n=1 Tax=Mya arenaria TaxID=6604 RepID=A0ABY7DGQ5_MYAAR|nr:hypothetical protein MAR_028486 [Mya arenaria]
MNRERTQFSCRHCYCIFPGYTELFAHIAENHPLNQQGGRKAVKERTSLQGRTASVAPSSNDVSDKPDDTVVEDDEDTRDKNRVVEDNVDIRDNNRIVEGSVDIRDDIETAEDDDRNDQRLSQNNETNANDESALRRGVVNRNIYPTDGEQYDVLAFFGNIMINPNREHFYNIANNLYGWAMVQPLPISDFAFMKEIEIETFDVMSIPENGDSGLEYPEDLHNEHNCLPLAPEQKTISDEQLSPYARQLLRKLNGLSENEPVPNRGEVEKLLTTLDNKDHNALHYRNLQLYLSLGMKLNKVHRILKIRQEQWMKTYIDLNTEMRKKATSTFQS